MTDRDEDATGLVERLERSAQIQSDAETKIRERLATTDRAELMREAAAELRRLSAERDELAFLLDGEKHCHLKDNQVLIDLVSRERSPRGAAMTRCIHEPQASGNVWDQLAGRVVCAKCGARGLLSRGRRKTGRTAKIFWEPASEPTTYVVPTLPARETDK